MDEIQLTDAAHQRMTRTWVDYIIPTNVFCIQSCQMNHTPVQIRGNTIILLPCDYFETESEILPSRILGGLAMLPFNHQDVMWKQFDTSKRRRTIILYSSLCMGDLLTIPDTDTDNYQYIVSIPSNYAINGTQWMMVSFDCSIIVNETENKYNTELFEISFNQQQQQQPTLPSIITLPRLFWDQLFYPCEINASKTRDAIQLLGKFVDNDADSMNPYRLIPDVLQLTDTGEPIKATTIIADNNSKPRIRRMDINLVDRLLFQTANFNSTLQLPSINGNRQLLIDTIDMFQFHQRSWQTAIVTSRRFNTWLRVYTYGILLPDWQCIWMLAGIHAKVNSQLHRGWNEIWKVHAPSPSTQIVFLPTGIIGLDVLRSFCEFMVPRLVDRIRESWSLPVNYKLVPVDTMLLCAKPTDQLSIRTLLSDVMNRPGSHSSTVFDKAHLLAFILLTPNINAVWTTDHTSEPADHTRSAVQVPHHEFFVTSTYFLRSSTNSATISFVSSSPGWTPAIAKDTVVMLCIALEIQLL